MALVAYDGFDHYATRSQDLLSRRGGGLQWNTLGTTGNPSFVSPGRMGDGSAITFGQNSGLRGTLTAPLQAAYFGFGAQLTTSNFPGMPSFQLEDQHALTAGQPTRQFAIALDIFRGGFNVYRGSIGGTLLGQSANNVVTFDAWNYLEFYIKVDNTAGAVTIKVNGETVLDLSGLDTQVTTNAQFDGILFFGAGAPTGTVMAVDDFYVADTAAGDGAMPFNTFAGNVRVITLHPISNVGTPGWTPLALTNWQEVAEAHADGDTSYNFTTSVGAKDLFNFAALSGTIATVAAVQVVGCYRVDDAANHTVSQHMLSSGTEVAGPNYVIPTQYVYCNDFYTTDPATGVAWTTAAVNALQAGYALTA